MPKHADSNLNELSTKLLNAKTALEALQALPFNFTSEGFAEREKSVSDLARDIATFSTGLQLQKAVFESCVSDLVANLSGKYRLVSWRPVTVTLGSGSCLSIWMPYFARKCAPGKGIYPHACLLGLVSGATPTLASLVSRYASALSSFKETRLMLEGLGIKMSEKRIKTITMAFARLAEMGRLASVESNDRPKSDHQIKRIVISTDGGRVRVRERKRGPKTKKGRSRYRAEWREPKLIIIMAIDDDGRPHTGIPPIIDATMTGPDAAFELMAQNLRGLDLTEATAAFVADGARWIWERVASFLSKLGLSEKCRCLVDFYHVCSHLETIASCLKGWNDKDKKRWLKKMRKWLRCGREKDVLGSIQEICKWTRSKVLKRERKYFERHLAHLAYAQAKKAGLPMGSGAVESAIRRVINLKIKGPGIIWHNETVEEMLTLRSYFKAGRWDQLELWVADFQRTQHS